MLRNLIIFHVFMILSFLIQTYHDIDHIPKQAQRTQYFRIMLQKHRGEVTKNRHFFLIQNYSTEHHVTYSVIN